MLGSIREGRLFGFSGVFGLFSSFLSGLWDMAIAFVGFLGGGYFNGHRSLMFCI